jgi:hypothetical protein
MLSGLQGQIKTVELRHYVFALPKLTNAPAPAAPGPDQDNSASNAQPLTKLFELGPVLDVVPLAQADGRSLALGVVASIRNFIGYDKEVGEAPAGSIGSPLPRFRMHQFSSATLVEDGQTLLLAGGNVTEELVEASGRVVLAKSERPGGTPPTETKKAVRGSRLIWITPRLLKSDGTPVHP